MIDVSFKELGVVFLVALLALKPKDLDYFARKLGRVARAWRSISIKQLLDPDEAPNLTQNPSLTKDTPKEPILPHDSH